MTETAAQEDLRRQLEAMDRLRLQRVGVYGTPQRFILTHGIWYAPQPLPAGIRPGRPRCCFDNAIQLAVCRGVPYVEGYALALLPEGTIALHHAWNLDAGARVIDTTWPDATTGGYLGVIFAPERADEATWDGDATILEDDRRKYPLLRQPWHGEDPARVWPPSPRLDRLRRKGARHGTHTGA